MADVGISNLTEGVMPNVIPKISPAAIQRMTDIAIWTVLGAIVLFGLWWWYREKQIFTYTAEIERVRANGQRKKVIGKCGYSKTKGIRSFMVKWGWKPTNRKTLDYLPDANKMDDNTFYFDQLDPDTFVQKEVIRTPTTVSINYRMMTFNKDYNKFKKGDITEVEESLSKVLMSSGVATYNDSEVITKTVDTIDISYQPISRENKVLFHVFASGVRGALRIDAFKQTAIFVGGFLILAITFLIAYGLLVNRG